jgi:long-chain-fatty-acid--[acyl-carrier-protein] ligase
MLASVRLIVVGAEKCPEALYEKVRSMAGHATLIEGYGITECSPIVAANREEKVKPGSVGPPLPGVEVKVVDPENHSPLALGQTGMLLVKGSSVFPGYIGEAGSPFVEADGQRWYVTGDLARMDEDGYIFLAGRLKRFLKAGGEMISLPALEEPLTQAYPPDDKGPRVAVEGVENHDGRRIVLFTTENILLREANALLQQKGLRGIMRLDEVRKIEVIPVLGTGKTDYKQLRAMI